MAGILEEALVTLEHDRPTYLLGGFGGAAETLANAILTPGAARPPQLTTAWHREHCDRLGSLLDSTEQFVHPPGFRTTTELLDALFAYVMKARAAPAETLRTGLTDDETRQMLKARDISEAVRLVRTGLTRSRKLPLLPA